MLCMRQYSVDVCEPIDENFLHRMLNQIAERQLMQHLEAPLSMWNVILLMHTLGNTERPPESTNTINMCLSVDLATRAFLGGGGFVFSTGYSVVLFQDHVLSIVISLSRNRWLSSLKRRRNRQLCCTRICISDSDKYLGIYLALIYFILRSLVKIFARIPKHCRKLLVTFAAVLYKKWVCFYNNN